MGVRNSGVHDFIVNDRGFPVRASRTSTTLVFEDHTSKGRASEVSSSMSLDVGSLENGSIDTSDELNRSGVGVGLLSSIDPILNIITRETENVGDFMDNNFYQIVENDGVTKGIVLKKT